MSVVGLVSIPGMMTGQILAGTDPSEAARYQVGGFGVGWGAGGVGVGCFCLGFAGGLGVLWVGWIMIARQGSCQRSLTCDHSIQQLKQQLEDGDYVPAWCCSYAGSGGVYLRRCAAPGGWLSQVRSALGFDSCVSEIGGWLLA